MKCHTVKYDTVLSWAIKPGPMKQQLGDYGAFWRMVWQQNVETIVMLTKLKEENVI